MVSTALKPTLASMADNGMSSVSDANVLLDRHGMELSVLEGKSVQEALTSTMLQTNVSALMGLIGKVVSVNQLDVLEDKYGVEHHATVMRVSTGMEVSAYFVLTVKFGIKLLRLVFVRSTTNGTETSARRK